MEGERMRVVGDLQWCKDGQLSSNPDCADAKSRWDLSRNVLPARAVLRDSRHDAKAQNAECPADPVLHSVLSADSFDSASQDDSGDRDGQCQREYIDTRANGRSVLDSLEVDGEINCV